MFTDWGERLQDGGRTMMIGREYGVEESSRPPGTRRRLKNPTPRDAQPPRGHVGRAAALGESGSTRAGQPNAEGGPDAEKSATAARLAGIALRAPG